MDVGYYATHLAPSFKKGLAHNTPYDPFAKSVAKWATQL
jgi:hypothetical protein